MGPQNDTPLSVQFLNPESLYLVGNTGNFKFHEKLIRLMQTTHTMETKTLVIFRQSHPGEKERRKDKDRQAQLFQIHHPEHFLSPSEGINESWREV